jgi:hypothetical protein
MAKIEEAAGGAALLGSDIAAAAGFGKTGYIWKRNG